MSGTLNWKLLQVNGDNSFFTANASETPSSGAFILNTQTKGIYVGDGVTQLQNLTLWNNSYTAGNGLTLSGSTFKLGGTLTEHTSLAGAYNLCLTDASARFGVGRTNPDRQIEAFSSTGLASIHAYSTLSSSYAGVYAQANNLAAYAGLVMHGSTYATNGLLIADSAYYIAAGNTVNVINANVVGDVVIGTGGYASANEKLRFSPTVTTFKGNTINIDNATASRIMATDASKNIQYLNTTTYPSLTELAYVKGVTSAIQTQIDSKAALGDVYFTTTHFHGLATIGTTTVFYDKYPSSSGVAGASGTVGATIIPFNCTLIGFALSIAVLGTLGTANTATVSVRVNNTTDITLTASALFSAATNRYSSSVLNTNLNAGDYIEIKLVPNCTPTAATNVTESVTLFFKRR